MQGEGTDLGSSGVSCGHNISSCVAIDAWVPQTEDEPFLVVGNLAKAVWTPTEFGYPSQGIAPTGISCPTIETCVVAGWSPIGDSRGHSWPSNNLRVTQLGDSSLRATDKFLEGTPPSLAKSRSLCVTCSSKYSSPQVSQMSAGTSSTTKLCPRRTSLHPRCRAANRPVGIAGIS